MINPELAHLIQEGVAPKQTNIIPHILDSLRVWQPKILIPQVPLILATAFPPYSTVSPRELIELAQDFRLSAGLDPSLTSSLIRRDEFIAIDEKGLNIYHLLPGTVDEFLPEAQSLNNQMNELELFMKYSVNIPGGHPTLDLVALGFGPDQLPDAELSAFSEYLSKCLRPESVVVATTHPIPSWQRTLYELLHKHFSKSLVRPLRSTYETIDIISGLANYSINKAPDGSDLLFSGIA